MPSKCCDGGGVVRCGTAVAACCGRPGTCDGGRAMVSLVNHVRQLVPVSYQRSWCKHRVPVGGSRW